MRHIINSAIENLQLGLEYPSDRKGTKRGVNIGRADQVYLAQDQATLNVISTTTVLDLLEMLGREIDSRMPDSPEKKTLREELAAFMRHPFVVGVSATTLAAFVKAHFHIP